MIFKFALSLLLFLSTSCFSTKSFVRANEYKRIDNFINIYNSELLTSNTSNQYNNSSDSNQSKSNYYETNVGFSNGKNDFDIFKKHINVSQSECFKACKNNIKCLGVFEYYGSTQENVTICNLLPKIEKPIFYNETTSSWLKVNEKSFEDTSYKIIGNLYDSYDLNSPERHYNNSKIYIDINHNGILDENEPFVLVNDYTSNYYAFEFNNLLPGTYLVRQEIPRGCYQLYPGIYGNYLDYYDHGNGYIDRVVYHYFHSHHSKARPHGGKIGSNNLIANVDYSYILGNNHVYYFTFYPDNVIIFSFVDETIIDTPGDDIYISTWGTSNTKAHLYVSHNNDNYYHLGVLDTSVNKTSFDLSNTLEKYPVSFIKLIFFSGKGELSHDTRYEGLNLVSIKGEINSLYEPSYAYYVKLSESNKRDYVIFFNDCHYLADCDLYCYFNLFTEDEIKSCLYGCQVFEKINNCNCNQNEVENVIFNGTYFDYRNCHLGCYQNMRMFVDPNYTLITNSEGYENHEINKISNCSSQCLNELLYDCNTNKECSAFTINNNYPSNQIHGHTYVQPYHKYNNNYNLFVKNEFLDLAYQSTTSTTSSTTTTSSFTSTSSSSTSSSTTSSFTSTSSSSTSSSTTSSFTSTSSSSTTSSLTTSSSLTSLTTTSGTSITSSTITSSTLTNTTTIKPIKMNSKKKNRIDKKLLIIIPLFTILSLLLIGILISSTLYYFKKKKEARIRNQMNQVSFTNPAYASPTITTELNEYQQGENIDNLTETGNYTDIETTNNNLTPSYNVDALYNDVYPESFNNDDVDKDYLEVH